MPKPKRFKVIFDLEGLRRVKECAWYDIGRLLAEHVVRLQLGLPPLVMNADMPKYMLTDRKVTSNS